MIAIPYWITPQFAIVPRPRGGDWLVDETLALKNAGIDVLLSLLEREESEDLGLALEREASIQAGLCFINFAIEDRGVPADREGFEKLLDDLERQIKDGLRVGIHCRASIGRSSVVAASLLLRSGLLPDTAWDQIHRARGCTIPDTAEQKTWVNENFSSPIIGFRHTWTAEILKSPPLIAPARQFMYPQQIAGEEDALERGALRLMVRPATGGTFLATCALGFRDPSMPTGVFACPAPDQLCAVAGGYAYMIDTTAPQQAVHLALRPVVEIRSLPANGLLLFVGFHTIVAWGVDGEAWQTARLSHEGVRIIGVEGNTLHGTGWNMLTDKDVPFTVDLAMGTHEGGGFTPSARS